ncbi:MAG: hypothetical protein ACOYEV_09400 [Candidatus Nanopelagicales bacterium]
MYDLPTPDILTKLQRLRDDLRHLDAEFRRLNDREQQGIRLRLTRIQRTVATMEGLWPGYAGTVRTAKGLALQTDIQVAVYDLDRKLSAPFGISWSTVQNFAVEKIRVIARLLMQDHVSVPRALTRD